MQLHSFAPLESSYGKSLEKPTQKLRRKLKSENNDNANKQESNEVLQLPRRLRYTIRRMHSGAASHYQTAGRSACSQLQRETNHPSQMPMHIERRTHVNEMQAVAEQRTTATGHHDGWLHRKDPTASKIRPPLARAKTDQWSRLTEGRGGGLVNSEATKPRHSASWCRGEETRARP